MKEISKIITTGEYRVGKHSLMKIHVKGWNAKHASKLISINLITEHKSFQLLTVLAYSGYFLLPRHCSIVLCLPLPPQLASFILATYKFYFKLTYFISYIPSKGINVQLEQLR